ncbi:MAG: hypothetical protein NW220_18965 [Leptolyngbyaceae cyanobacterium bins.349]|nr:hypothetical protein [Leptolyngbyaceae cyanobacterium bins.349]
MYRFERPLLENANQNSSALATEIAIQSVFAIVQPEIWAGGIGDQLRDLKIRLFVSVLRLPERIERETEKDTTLHG